MKKPRNVKEILIAEGKLYVPDGTLEERVYALEERVGIVDWFHNDPLGTPILNLEDKIEGMRFMLNRLIDLVPDADLDVLHAESMEMMTQRIQNRPGRQRKAGSARK